VKHRGLQVRISWNSHTAKFATMIATLTIGRRLAGTPSDSGSIGGVFHPRGGRGRGLFFPV